MNQINYTIQTLVLDLIIHNTVISLIINLSRYFVLLHSFTR